MSVEQRALVFDCAGDRLVGVVTLPHGPSAHAVGVVVVVGGPQYRVGSHRQFALLSRALAEQGVASLRFDYRGMGDSTGEARAYTDIDADIRAAIDAFVAGVPDLRQVVLWGLCDGASAACLYAPQDDRVHGLVLLNPWVRTEHGLARTHVKHYYWSRLVDRTFWKKLLSGKVALVGSLRGFSRALSLALRGDETRDEPPAERMARCLEEARRPFLVLLSGRDYVAKEFEDAMGIAGSRWGRLAQLMTLRRYEVADHTFSSRQWRDGVADATINWLHRCVFTGPSDPNAQQPISEEGRSL
jgi:exosortase A-associated hydrolase 1